jgi:hypothetical protein
MNTKTPLRRTLSAFRRPVAAVSAVAGLLAMMPGVANAQVAFYSSRASFNVVAPGLPVDDFQSDYTFSPYPNDSAYHARPVSAATSDALIPAGCILPGLSITTTNPLTENQAIKAESAGAGILSIGTGTFQDVLVLDFPNAVSAVGADVFGHVYPGPVFAGNVEVTVYSGSRQIGYVDPTLPTDGPGFVGVTSPTADITSVSLLFNPANDSSDANTFVSHVAFGVAPEPSPVAVLGVGGLLMLGFFAHPREKV